MGTGFNSFVLAAGWPKNTMYWYVNTVGYAQFLFYRKTCCWKILKQFVNCQLGIVLIASWLVHRLVRSTRDAWFLFCLGIAENTKKSFSCFAGIRQGQDQNYWKQVDSGRWDGWSVWTERGVGKLLSTIPDLSGENNGRLIDFNKGWDRRWVRNAYT